MSISFSRKFRLSQITNNNECLHVLLLTLFTADEANEAESGKGCELQVLEADVSER